jgi:hypothetical protein
MTDGGFSKFPGKGAHAKDMSKRSYEANTSVQVGLLGNQEGFLSFPLLGGELE